MLQMKMVLLGVAIALAAAAAQAELISNGSFESVARTGDGYSVADNSTFTNWNCSSVSIVWGNHWNAGAPEDGNQYALLTKVDSNRASGEISQTIATTVGTKYELKFWYAALSNGNSQTAYLTYTAANSSGSNDLSNTLSISTTNVSNLKLSTWTEATATFVATSASTTLSFIGTNISTAIQDTYGVGIDNVSLNPVPEPSTTMLFGVGISGLLAYAWRKRRHSN